MPRGKVNKPMRDFAINWFEPEKMSKGSIAVVLAKKNMGKSWLTLDYMYKLGDRFSHGIIVTQTAGTSKNGYDRFCPDMFIHDKFDDEKLMEIMNEKKKALDELRRRKEMDPESIKIDIEKEWFIILDDCMDDKAVKNSQFLKTVGLRGRHVNLFCIIITNSTKQISKELREAADYIMLFQPQGTSAMEEISKEYCPVGYEIHEFRHLLQTLTLNRGVLVVNKPMGSNVVDLDDKSKPNDAVQYYRAGDEHTRVKWQMGGKKFNRVGKQFRRKVAIGSSIALKDFGNESESEKKKPAAPEKTNQTQEQKTPSNMKLGDHVTVLRPRPAQSTEPKKEKLPELPSPDQESSELSSLNRKKRHQDRKEKHHKRKQDAEDAEDAEEADEEIVKTSKKTRMTKEENKNKKRKSGDDDDNNDFKQSKPRMETIREESEQEEENVEEDNGEQEAAEEDNQETVDEDNENDDDNDEEYNSLKAKPAQAKPSRPPPRIVKKKTSATPNLVL